MGLRPLEIFFSCSAGINFRRQILTTKVDPRTVRVKSTLGLVSHISWLTPDLQQAPYHQQTAYIMI